MVVEMEHSDSELPLRLFMLLPAEVAGLEEDNCSNCCDSCSIFRRRKRCSRFSCSLCCRWRRSRSSSVYNNPKMAQIKLNIQANYLFIHSVQRKSVSSRKRKTDGVGGEYTQRGETSLSGIFPHRQSGQSRCYYWFPCPPWQISPKGTLRG